MQMCVCLPAVSLSEDSLLVFSRVSLVLLLLGRWKDEAISTFSPPLKQSCVIKPLRRCDASADSLSDVITNKPVNSRDLLRYCPPNSRRSAIFLKSR